MTVLAHDCTVAVGSGEFASAAAQHATGTDVGSARNRFWPLFLKGFRWFGVARAARIRRPFHRRFAKTLIFTQ